jgi:predicted metal-dependent peptidase
MQEFDKNRVYTPEEVQSARDKITKARIKLLMSSPFFGQLITRLGTPINASKWCPTAATDGKHLYFNTGFVNDLDDQECILMCHEVMHVCYDHMGRRSHRDPSLFNMANDHVINLQITDQGIGKIIYREGVCEPCCDKKYKDMTSEEVYELLLKESEKQGKKFNKVSFDFHIEDGMQTDPTGENGPIPISEQQKKMLSEQIKQAIIAAVKAGGKSSPDAIRRMVDELTDPKMDWRSMITQSILSILKSDYTFNPPSKKSWGTGGIMIPGMPNEFKADIAVCIDTSGSITHDMVRDFLSEIKGIMEQFKDFDLRVWCFDTRVMNPQQFTPDIRDEIDDYDVQGGGGTTFEVNWEYMKENDIVPHQFIMFTDGYPCGGWGDEDYCDTIFLVHGDDSIEAPFGLTCHYEE